MYECKIFKFCYLSKDFLRHAYFEVSLNITYIQEHLFGKVTNIGSAIHWQYFESYTFSYPEMKLSFQNSKNVLMQKRRDVI